MAPRRARSLGLLFAASVFGCGSSGGNPYSFDVGSDEGGPSFVASGMDGGQSGLDAHVENSKHVAVQFVTLSCSNSCATVEAVGTGGNPPYSFKWDNGSTTATRQVCPSSSTSYNVKVTDTGSVGEITRGPETASASLTADVLSCPDASSLPCVGVDAAVAAVQSGRYVGTVFCPPDGGVLETPTADGGDSAGTLTLDLSINGTAVGGSLYFIWSVDDGPRDGHRHGVDHGSGDRRGSGIHFGELRLHPDERRLLPRDVFGRAHAMKG